MGVFMDKQKLCISQYVLQHPVKAEKEKYKHQYIRNLEYFVRKYNPKDKWTVSVLELYKEKLLENQKIYRYEDDELKRISQGLMTWKMRKYRFFTYRYVFLADVIFMCAYQNKEKAKLIFQEIEGMYHNRYSKKLRELFDDLFELNHEQCNLCGMEYIYTCFKENQQFLQKREKNILITANMSAGKSTLLNALVGKKVNRTQNDACTAKIHFLMNKALEDGLDYEWDYELDLNAEQKELMTDNLANNSREIYVGTHFRSLQDINARIVYIDTPGVNSSQDIEHRQISENAIMNYSYDTMIFLLNGENIGTDDERNHLEFIAKNYQGRTIFVVNKLDRYSFKDDSVAATMEQVKRDLITLGYENPLVYPISAYAGYLTKMALFGEKLNEDEEDELERMKRKLRKTEFQFDTYYPEEIQKRLANTPDDEISQTLLHSGILALEHVLEK